MAAFTRKLEVEILNLEVGPKYFSFDYKITLDGKLFNESSYESDHNWSDDIESFEDLLKGRYAMSLALEQEFGYD